MKNSLRITLLLALLFLALPGFAGLELEGEPDAAGMPLHQALILGVIEGLTEYLPVSSTGHLLLTQRLLGIGAGEDAEAADAFAIVIQFGAILAVLSLYTQHIRMLFLGLIGKSKEGLQLLINLIVAFIPAAVIGLLFVDAIKSVLFGLWPVTFAWFVGGLALVVFRTRGEAGAGKEMSALSPKQALVVGLIQCIAMWPGTSRSLVTILGGRLMGLSIQAAVTFSFLLGMVTLSASTAYDTLKHGQAMVDAFGIGSLVAGVITGWIAAMLAVKWMVGYLQKHGLALFGWYRIGLALVTAGLLLSGVVSP